MDLDQEQITETLSHIMELVTAYGLQVVGAVLILIVGWIAAGWARNAADKGRRLDHVWTSPSLKGKAIKMEVLRNARGWEKPSDHAPVLVDFDF